VTGITSTLHGDQYTFLIISRSVHLRMRNSFRRKLERKSKHEFHVQPLKKNRAVYKIMWKNIVQLGRPQMTMWRMRIACGYLRLQMHTQNF